MTYRLVIVTDGRGLLADTVASFAANVEPPPVDVDVRCDGPDAYAEAAAAEAAGSLQAGRWRVYGSTGEGRDGFCRATAHAWRQARRPGVDFVFWLEDDFRFLRGVDLGQLARILDARPRLAQVALCRGPANDVERAAGGLVAARPGQYAAAVTDGVGWMEHRAYFTTTPSLMRRDFMARRPFPSDVAECEGVFGMKLAADGYTFGLMGSGEPWVDHVGVRAGEGY